MSTYLVLEGLLLIGDIGDLKYATNKTAMKNLRGDCGCISVTRGFERLINSTHKYVSRTCIGLQRCSQSRLSFNQQRLVQLFKKWFSRHLYIEV